MKLNHENFDESLKSSKRVFPERSSSTTPQKTPDKTMTLYTGLRILVKMRQKLGLEAMLEYIEKYFFVIEKENPEIKDAVQRALSLMSVEKMYWDVRTK